MADDFDPDKFLRSRGIKPTPEPKTEPKAPAAPAAPSSEPGLTTLRVRPAAGYGPTPAATAPSDADKSKALESRAPNPRPGMPVGMARGIGIARGLAELPVGAGRLAGTLSPRLAGRGG